MVIHHFHFNLRDNFTAIFMKTYLLSTEDSKCKLVSIEHTLFLSTEDNKFNLSYLLKITPPLLSTEDNNEFNSNYLLRITLLCYLLKITNSIQIIF